MPDDPRTSEIGNTRATSIRRPECRSEDENTTSHFRSLLRVSVLLHVFIAFHLAVFSREYHYASFSTIL